MPFKTTTLLITFSLFLFSLTLNQSTTANLQPKQTIQSDPITVNLFTFTDLEEIQVEVTDLDTGLVNNGWGEYEDILVPGTDINGAISWVTNDQTTGKALQCEILNGRAYNNYYCVNNFAKLNGSLGDYPYEGLNQIELELDFYVDGSITCNPSIRSDMEGVEFTWQFTQPPKSFGFGIIYIPWKGQLRHWTEKDGWANFDPPITDLCIEGNKWHNVKFESSMFFDQIIYHTMILNGETIDLHDTTMPVFKTFEHWKDTFVQVGFQLDSTVTSNEDTNARPVALLIDNVDIVGNKVTFVLDHKTFLPIIRN